MELDKLRSESTLLLLLLLLLLLKCLIFDVLPPPVETRNKTVRYGSGLWPIIYHETLAKMKSWRLR